MTKTINLQKNLKIKQIFCTIKQNRKLKNKSKCPRNFKDDENVISNQEEKKFFLKWCLDNWTSIYMEKKKKDLQSHVN